MKKTILFLLTVLLALSFAACNSASGPADITDDAIGQVDEGQMTLNSYNGKETNIEIPDYMEGAPVSSIAQSFAEGKAFESVVLPERIQGCYRDENGKLVLTTWEDTGVIPINEETAAWIYCSFFGVDSIQVNEITYVFNTANAVTDEMIVGQWRMRGDILYTFTADHKITMSDGTVQYEGDWQRQDNRVTMQMDADFDDNTVELEYCDGCLVSWEYGVTLYQGDVPEDPVYEEVKQDDNTAFEDYVSDDFTYSEREDGICLWAYNGTDPVVHIPEKIDGKTVVALDMSANDAIRELHIPKTVKMVHEIRQALGLEVIYWTGVEDGSWLTGLNQCYDLKELHLPGITSIDLSNVALYRIERLAVLDISDCQRVIGPSSVCADEIYVSENIKYAKVPNMETGWEELTATRTEYSMEITDENRMEAWNLIFPADTGLQKINGVEYAPAGPLIFDEGWWSGWSADGVSNGKVLYINSRGFSYIADASVADRKDPENTMEAFEIGIAYDWWFFDDQLWDLKNHCYYMREE